MKARLAGVWILLAVFITGFSSICSAGDIRLMFPKVDSDERKSAAGTSYIVFDKNEQFGKNEYVEKELSEFVKEMESPGYRVDQIELWVEGREESGGITRLYISMEGSKGYRVILRLKSQ